MVFHKKIPYCYYYYLNYLIFINIFIFLQKGVAQYAFYL